MSSYRSNLIALAFTIGLAAGCGDDSSERTTEESGGGAHADDGVCYLEVKSGLWCDDGQVDAGTWAVSCNEDAKSDCNAAVYASSTQYNLGCDWEIQFRNIAWMSASECTARTEAGVLLANGTECAYHQDCKTGCCGNSQAGAVCVACAVTTGASPAPGPTPGSTAACSGPSCCGPANNSRLDGNGKCSCDEGYVWLSSDLNDLRCTKDPGSAAAQEPADLVVASGRFTVLPPVAGDPYVYACFNVDAEGAFADNGSHIQIANNGRGTAAPFSVGFALVSLDGGPYAFGETELNMDESLPAGHSVTFEPEGCCAILTNGLPAGSYRLWVLADAYDVVSESDEGNNYATATDGLVLH